MKIAIVGSRRRCSLFDRELVTNIVMNARDRGDTIVSGACRSGADSFAKQICDLYKLTIKEFPVPEKNYKSKWEFREAAFARNKQIAEYCDVCFALVTQDRSGGTENTIDHCHELGKRVFLVLEDGSIVEEEKRQC